MTTITETMTHSITQFSRPSIVPDGILAANLCRHHGFAFPPTADGVYIAKATESFASKEFMDVPVLNDEATINWISRNNVMVPILLNRHFFVTIPDTTTIISIMALLIMTILIVTYL
jgi:hypothetical protein